MRNAHPEDAQLGWTPVFPEVLSSVLSGGELATLVAPVGQAGHRDRAHRAQRQGHLLSAGPKALCAATPWTSQDQEERALKC